MSDELQELQEHAEHGHQNPSLAPVSLTMAVLAVLVAVVSLLGHRAHTEEVVLQAKSSDQWAYYQAKNIREHEDDLLRLCRAVIFCEREVLLIRRAATTPFFRLLLADGL